MAETDAERADRWFETAQQCKEKLTQNRVDSRKRWEMAQHLAAEMAGAAKIGGGNALLERWATEIRTIVKGLDQ